MRTATISTAKLREIYQAEYARSFRDYVAEKNAAYTTFMSAPVSQPLDEDFPNYSRRIAAAERIWNDTSVMIITRFKDLTGECLF